MTTLNHCLEYSAETYLDESARIELDLQDSALEIPDEAGEDIFCGVSQLINEIWEHNQKGDKLRFRSSYTSDSQTVKLEWGRQLLKRELEIINERLRAGRESNANEFRGGNYTAGFLISRWGGKVRAENTGDSVYASRYVIDLPLRFEEPLK